MAGGMKKVEEEGRVLDERSAAARYEGEVRIPQDSGGVMERLRERRRWSP